MVKLFQKDQTEGVSFSSFNEFLFFRADLASGEFLKGQCLLLCTEPRANELIFLQQRHFNRLDLSDMRGLLNDAAGRPRGALLPLRHVGQGHGGVHLLPVRLVFALHPVLLRSCDATAAADDGADVQTCRERRKQRQTFSGERSDGGCKVREAPLTCHFDLIQDRWFLQEQEGENVH